MGESTSVSKSGARNVRALPGTDGSAVFTSVQPDGNSMWTSCGRAAVSTSERNVGAPFKSDGPR